MRRLCLVLAALPLYSDILVSPPPKPPPTPREVAWRVLSTIHLVTGKANPPVQPYLLLHLAENTVEFNRKLALTEYHDSFSDSRIMETTYRAPLQAGIVSSVAPIDIPTAIDFVRAIRPNPAQRFARDTWDQSVNAINGQLLGRNRPNEAVELIKLVSFPGIFPNQAASTMIRALPSTDDRRLGIFGYAATCYRQVTFPGFPSLIQDHWRTMPRSVVVLAADAVADEAPHLTPPELAQILPVLREVDAPRAERLLRDHPELDDPPPPKPRKPNYQQQDEDRTVARVSGLALRSPDRALSAVDSIRDPEVRKDIILQIASNTLSSGGDPEIANRALQQLLRLPGKSQRDLAPLLAELATYSGKRELAAQYVDASFELAAKLLEADLDAKSECGVNPAPKDWWPSTVAYRAAIHASVSLFHTAAERYLGRVDEPDLYLLMSVEFAHALLGHGATATPATELRGRRRDRERCTISEFHYHGNVGCAATSIQDYISGSDFDSSRDTAEAEYRSWFNTGVGRRR